MKEIKGKWLLFQGRLVAGASSVCFKEVQAFNYLTRCINIIDRIQHQSPDQYALASPYYCWRLLYITSCDIHIQGLIFLIQPSTRLEHHWQDAGTFEIQPSDRKVWFGPMIVQFRRLDLNSTDDQYGRTDGAGGGRFVRSREDCGTKVRYHHHHHSLMLCRQST